jgi:hypothetical protein
MRVTPYDPAQRALAKAESRRRDAEALRSGLVSRNELQRINGGDGLFRGSQLVRRLAGPDVPADKQRNHRFDPE